jgi:hypothetical protein
MEKLIPIVLILLLLVSLGRRAVRSFGDTACNNCGGVLASGTKFCNSCGQITGAYISNGTMRVGILLMLGMSIGLMGWCLKSMI